jgi:3-oxoacyl-[acyl-carrier-protein] synthase II
MTRRVVVTGLGLVTPLGNNVPDSWANIKEGKSGIGLITYFDTSNYLVKIAAQLKDFDPHNYMERTEVRRHDPYQHYIIAAAKEAITHAGFEVRDGEQNRASSVVGSSTGGLRSFQEYSDLIRETQNPRKMTPFGIPMLVVNAGSNVVSIMTGACGPSCIPVSACASGADCIGYAFDLIRFGRIDKAVAGCGDYPIMDLGIAAFDRIGAMSRDNDTPERASRPFCATRSGFVFGEGAGVLVLEELEYARQRGANILAELVGYASTSDAFHRTAPDPKGLGAVEAMKIALEIGQINTDEVSYINAHGTATELNDAMETTAVKTLFGEHAYQLAMSSTKSMTGHAMGTTAAMEAVFSVMAIQEQVAPPTISYTTPDPNCDLDYVPNEARTMPINVVMSNSFGFGGHNASLVFRKFDG